MTERRRQFSCGRLFLLGLALCFGVSVVLRWQFYLFDSTIRAKARFYPWEVDDKFHPVELPGYRRRFWERMAPAPQWGVVAIYLRNRAMSRDEWSRVFTARNVRYLDLRSTNCSDTDLARASSLAHLKVLVVDYSDVTIDGIAELAARSRLSTVSMRGYELDETAVRTLSQCGIRTIVVDETPRLTESAMEAARECGLEVRDSSPLILEPLRV